MARDDRLGKTAQTLPKSSLSQIGHFACSGDLDFVQNPGGQIPGGPN